MASTYEFLDIIRAIETSRGVMVSLDVESLFTNVPVEDTIQIVIDNVYNHDELAPPNIPPNLLRDMLLTCTMEAQLHLFIFSTSIFIYHPYRTVICTAGWMLHGLMLGAYISRLLYVQLGK